MESLELRIFKEVAYTKSISKAAENMGYVQSNVTAHIKALERELNTELFIRHNRGVNLTKDGELLLYHAEKIIHLLDNATKLLKKTEKTLKIGTTQTIAGYLLPLWLTEYQKEFPNRSICVSTIHQEDLDNKILDNQFDCVITNNTYNISNYKKIYQCEEDLVMIAPNSCQAFDDIGDLALVTNKSVSCPYRKILLNWWHKHNDDSPKLIELNTVDAILNTVAKGGGISVLPRNIVKSRKDVNCFRIDEFQSTFIQVWISQNMDFDECMALIQSIEMQLTR